MSTANRKNGKTAVILFVVAGRMVGLAFASVLLYQLFYQAAGYGGTTVTATTKPTETVAADAPVITVRFDANVDLALPWGFSPDQKEIKVRIGEERLAFFTAKNWGGREIIGNASFNVTPYKVGQYFQKIECFCFMEQKLVPGQEVSMPVSFFVAPEMLKNSNAMYVRDITLSYTFYRAPADEEI
jgi:cytochrome c oxidase assembly protein subunit 11